MSADGDGCECAADAAETRAGHDACACGEADLPETTSEAANANAEPSEEASEDNAEVAEASASEAESAEADVDTAAGESETGNAEPGAEEDESSALPLESVIEALLFSARAPLTVKQLAKCAGKGTRLDTVREALAALNRHYNDTGRAFEIVEVADKLQFMSRPEYARHIFKLQGKKPSPETEKKLTGASLDTLSIVAYKQPITRVEIETVRGVACGQIVRALIERGSIKVVGKKLDVVGQPWLYGTTEEFLKEFGLASLEELPMIQELRQMTGAGALPAAPASETEEADEEYPAAAAEDEDDESADEDEDLDDDDDDEEEDIDDEEIDEDEESDDVEDDSDEDDEDESDEDDDDVDEDEE